MEPARIGILGGTFDPIHVGHLIAAVNARDALRLDKVLLMVAPNPWQKADRTISPAEVRFAAVKAAVARVRGLEASRLEIDRGGPTYMVDTLRQLKDTYPEATLFMIGGMDLAAGFHTWREPEAVAGMAEVILVDRPGSPMPKLPSYWKVHRVGIPGLDISSTELRMRMKAGLPVDYLIPQPALDVMRGSGLYSGIQENSDSSDTSS